MAPIAKRLPELLKDGSLPAYAWPGGYPILYLDGDNSVICAECATRSLDDAVESFRPNTWDVHYEGPAEFCEDCGKEIPSAYGNPEGEEN